MSGLVYASILIQSALYLAVPLLAIELAKRYRFFEWLNPVVFCYLFGMAMANQGLFGVHAPTAKTFTEAAIPLAVPLILFPSDFRAWLRQSRSTVISFCCAVVAVCIVSSVGAVLFSGMTEEYWKASGMLVGVYTGGTPNLVSIGMALEAKEELFVLLNAADVVVSAFYLLFLLTIAQKTLSFLLPAFSLPEGEADGGAETESEAVTEEGEEFDLRKAAPSMAAAFGLSVLILGASAGVTMLVAGELAVAGVFLGLTTGGIAGSFSDKIRNLEGSYELGNYCILVFCVAMGARTDFAELVAAGSGIVIYTGFVVYGSVLLHLALAAAFRIDVDTYLVTSTAALFGPAFVPPIAEAIDNRWVVLSGLTAGLVGYAVANYLGIGLAYLLQPVGR